MKKLNEFSVRISNEFSNFFSKRLVNKRARNSKFTKRKAKKLNGYEFLVAMSLGRFKKCAQQSLLNY